MANKGKSVKGMFGTVYHYDEHGKYTGKSEPGLFGTYYNYDKNGHRSGKTEPGLFGTYYHYDQNGKNIGKSEPGIFDNYYNYDKNGHKIGESQKGVLGDTYHHKDNQGCYVATCVYGSYDCPQVWTLRRFRDNTLAKNILGRAFIHTYYAISPTIVKWFGETKWFKKMWRGVLDNMVQNLRDQGVEDTPYEDKEW